MYFDLSPEASPSSKPISIRNMASPSGSVYSTFSHDISPASRGSTVSSPSWPTGSSLGFRSAPSSFISDADLFPEELDDEYVSSGPLLQEAPAPPRQPPMAQAFPLLPPLYASEKPKKRRRSSGRKQRRPSKPMTPISESPEAPSE